MADPTGFAGSQLALAVATICALVCSTRATCLGEYVPNAITGSSSDSGGCFPLHLDALLRLRSQRGLDYSSRCLLFLTPSLPPNPIPYPPSSSPIFLSFFAGDFAVGECELAANFGYPDEPMAGGCGANKFLCPDAHTCVSSARHFAACSSSKPLIAYACNLTGKWACGGIDGWIRQTTDTCFVVSPQTSTTPWLWKSGSATIDGDSILIHYVLTAGGTTARTGKLAADCLSIVWNDSSTWTCENCADQKLLDVFVPDI